MFTKNDYKQYFKAIQNADKNMVMHLNSILSMLSDTHTIQKLTHIRDQELHHLELSEELFRLVE